MVFGSQVSMMDDGGEEVGTNVIEIVVFGLCVSVHMLGAGSRIHV